MAGSQDTLNAVLGLLANAMSTDGSVQKEAEKSIRAQIDLHPEMMIGAMVHLISQQSTPPEVIIFPFDRDVVVSHQRHELYLPNHAIALGRWFAVISYIPNSLCRVSKISI